tara:strand:+ start:1912 stop:2184 length:273 start_codon:yes stop_codon:yes gene_type:complete
MGVTNNQPKPITRMTNEVKGILSDLMQEGIIYHLSKWENFGYCGDHDYDGNESDFEPSCECCQEIKQLMYNYDRACEVERFITKKLNLEA